MSGGVVVITGASSGLGAAFARVVAADGYDVLLVARRADRLEALAVELADRFAVRAFTLPVDLATGAAASRIAQKVSELGSPVAALINNAGYYLDGQFLELGWDSQAAMLQVMVTAPTELVHRLLPSMIAAGGGRVITVASLGGLLHSTPRQTLYGPTKRFGIALSRGLASEYAGTGVTFTAVCPGLTRTEMMERGSAARAGSRVPSWLVAGADDVALDGWKGAARGRRVMVHGWSNKATAGLLRVLPADVGDRLMDSVFGALTAS